MNDSAPIYDIPALRAKFIALLGEHTTAYPQHVEQEFPRILAQLTERWGTPSLGPYIDSLVFSDRPTRNGFPDPVAAELFRLSSLHLTLNPGRSLSATGWEQTDDADLARSREKKAER